MANDPVQYVTIVSTGGTPVRLADQRGAPHPTTGHGALVFNVGPHLIDATLEGDTLVSKASVFVGPEPPEDPIENQLWWSNVLGQLFVWYNDGNTTQWVIANASSSESPGGDGNLGGSLNLADLMEGDAYCNDAFVRAQTTLLNSGLRGLYVPGGRTYRADPAKPEIQLTLDDLHIWGEGDPVFSHAIPGQGFFQIVYAKRVKIEGVRIILDSSIIRMDITGSYAGDKYNGRRSAIGIYDADDAQVEKVFMRNWCGGFIGKGYHTSVELDAWKAMPPHLRIPTHIDLTNVLSMGDFPNEPSSARRAGGMTRLFGLRTEHCDFGILYHSIENMRIDDLECKDTTITAAHPHAIYAAGNITSNIMKYDEFGNPIGLSDPSKPAWVVLKDKSNGTCKASNIRDYDNPYAPSFKFRVHDQCTVVDAYSHNAAGGLTFNNNDAAFLDGATVQGCRAGLTGDLPNDDGDDSKNSVGLQVSGCRDSIFQNVFIAVEGGTPDVSPVITTDTHGPNQRINPTTGELICSRNNRLKNIYVQTNYSNGDHNRDYDPPPFVPGVGIKPVFQFGDDGDSIGTGMSFEDCKHVDIFGYYPTEMFYLRSGSGHRIITPTRKGTAYLARVHRDCTDNLIVIDPDLCESRAIRHDPPPIAPTDYSRVHVIRPIKGDNSAYLADFGPLDTGANVAETMNRAATIVGRRGPGTILMPSGDVPVGPYLPIQISPTEGSAIIMTAAMSNITWQGRNTVLKPISNKIAVFEINGAANTKFKGIKFDNSANGILKDQVATLLINAPGGGVAANGNNANMSVCQWTGASVWIDDCDFIQMHTGLKYFGNYLDISQLVGTASITNSRFDGCAQGFLPSQPEHIVFNGNFWLNGTDSIAANDIAAPGHAVYITNRSGAAPYTVMANNNYARHCSSSVIKLRKGVTQVCTGNVFEDVHRGIESHNARTTTITGNDIKLVKWPVDRIPRWRDPSEGYIGGIDDNQSAIEVSGCYGGGTIANNTIDRSGSYGYALRVRAADLFEDDSGELGDGEYPRNLMIHHNKIVDDCSSAMIQPFPDPPDSPTAPLPPLELAPFKPWLWIGHLTDGEVSDNTLHVLTDTVVKEYMIAALYCERTKFFDNARMNVFRSEGSDLLINLNGACNDCTVGIKAEDIPVAITLDTVSDAGSNTRRLRTDGIKLEEWTPVPTFDPVPAAYVPVIAKAVGWIERQGDMATIGCNLNFNTGPYTAPPVGTGGFFKILFPYTADTFAAPFFNSVGFHRQFTIPSANLTVGMRHDEGWLTLHYNEAAGDGKRLTTDHVEPSKLIDIGFQIRVKLNPVAPFDHVILPETNKLLLAGWTPSTTTVLNRVDQCIRDLKAFELWDKILACWGANSLLNWKNPGINTLTAVGVPLFIEDDYFAGANTDTDYWDTGLNLSTGGAGIYTLNAASMWRFSITESINDTGMDMGIGPSAYINGMTVSENMICTTNSAATALTPVTSSRKLAGWTRTSATAVTLFQNRAPTGLVVASTAVSATPLRIGQGGAAGMHSGRRMKFAGVGGALTIADIRNLDSIIDHYAQF